MMMLSHRGPMAITALVVALLALDSTPAYGESESAPDDAARSESGSGLTSHVVAASGGHVATLRGNPVRGKTLYETYCSSCHGTTGKGNGPAAAILTPKPRDHTNSSYMATLTDEYLADVIRRGGAPLGRSPAMPPAKTLSDEDIDDLIARIRSLAQ
jgi:mono/diheme cytochrome c family protein